MMITTGKRVKTQRATIRVRKGLRLIADVVAVDFDNAFARLFPDATAQELSDVMEAVNWLEQYAVEDW